MTPNEKKEADLKKNIKAFEKKLPELKKHHSGKWVVFHDSKYVDAFDSFENAAEHVVKTFGRDSYLIRKVDAAPVRLSTIAMRILEAS